MASNEYTLMIVVPSNATYETFLRIRWNRHSPFFAALSPQNNHKRRWNVWLWLVSEDMKLAEFSDQFYIAFDTVCQMLDTGHKGCGNYEQVAKHYGIKSYTIKSRLEKHEGGPSKGLFEYLRSEHPDLTLGQFFIVLEGIKRKDVVAAFRAARSQSKSRALPRTWNSSVQSVMANFSASVEFPPISQVWTLESRIRVLFIPGVCFVKARFQTCLWITNVYSRGHTWTQRTAGATHIQ